MLHIFFFFNDPSTPLTYTLSLHDALPIWLPRAAGPRPVRPRGPPPLGRPAVRRAEHRELRARSEEHTSELQSRFDLVCRLLLEKKNFQQPPSAGTMPDSAK